MDASERLGETLYRELGLEVGATTTLETLNIIAGGLLSVAIGVHVSANGALSAEAFVRLFRAGVQKGLEKKHLRMQ